jgi:hypothetical protein
MRQERDDVSKKKISKFAKIPGNRQNMGAKVRIWSTASPHNSIFSKLNEFADRRQAV